MSKPQTLDEVLEECNETDWEWNGEDEYPVDVFNTDKAKAALSLMVEEILGDEWYCDSYENDTDSYGTCKWCGESYHKHKLLQQRERAKQLGFIIGGSK